MASLLEFADRAFAYVLYAGWQAAWLAAIVLVVVGTLRNRVPVRWQFALWMVVLVRLALPAVPASPWSLFNLPAEVVTAWGGRELPGGVTRMSASPGAGGTLAVATEVVGSSNPQTASPAPAGAVAPASHGEPFASPLRWLVLVWATGASCLLLRRGCQVWRMSQGARRWRAVVDPQILSLFEECRRQAGVRRVVRLIETPDDVGPAASGLWRPQILLPRALPGMLAADELRFVLLHELLHFRRHDILLDWLASLVTIVHWMNPIAWLALARIRCLREVACDARVLDVVGTGQQRRYGLAVLKVVEQLVAPRPLSASAGAFGSQAALTTRIRAIRNHRPTTPWASAAGWSLLLTLVATGLTDAWHAPADSIPPPPAPAEGPANTPATQAVAGICRDGAGNPLSGVSVRLYRLSPSVPEFELLGQHLTVADGRFAFANLRRPKNMGDDFFSYCVVGAAPGRAADSAVIVPGSEKKDLYELRHPAAVTLAGQVTDRQGRPVADAVVWVVGASSRRPVPGLWNAQTDRDGRYAITDLPPQASGDQAASVRSWLEVLHPDYARDRQSYTRVPDTVAFTLDRASSIEGRVVDEASGHSAAGLVVSLQGVMNPPLSSGDTVAWEQARTDSQGRYRLTSLRAGTYNIWADAADRACVAIDSLAVPAAQTVVAPDIRLAAGGWIEGHVWDAEKGRALSRHPDTGQPISIAWYGPSRPKSGPACQTTTVDEHGVFRIRVAPGKSYPYIQFSDLWQRTWPRVAFTEGIDVRPGEVETLVLAVSGNRRPEVRERSLGTLSPPVPEEREAAEAIRQLGGWYALDADQHVVEVNMVYHEDAAVGKRYDNPQTDTDAVLQHLTAFPRLKGLFLTQGQATDRSLPLVAGRTSLEVLMIWEARGVSDVGVAHLAKLVNLNNLHINNGKLTDRSLAILSRLPRLQHLSLQGNAFTDEGLRHLRDMTQLRSLWLGLGASRFTDAGLVHLAKLANLEELDLQGSPLTRSGREQLEKLPKLRSLYPSTP